jgi:hypothetical protein
MNTDLVSGSLWYRGAGLPGSRRWPGSAGPGRGSTLNYLLCPGAS